MATTNTQKPAMPPNQIAARRRCAGYGLLIARITGSWPGTRLNRGAPSGAGRCEVPVYGLSFTFGRWYLRLRGLAPLDPTGSSPLPARRQQRHTHFVGGEGAVRGTELGFVRQGRIDE